VARPAVISAEQVSYVDLALDLLVFPDGMQLVLDEDEFEALPLGAEDRRMALHALQELKELKWKPLI
jgi:protein associated with RNAse G/E